MNTKKILNSEIDDLKIASLPTRPTAPTAFGGKGYTASDMKAAFDKLPLFIIERFNTLLEDIAAEDESSVIFSIPSGIEDGHTLGSLLRDITTGKFAGYLDVGAESLSEYKLRLAADFERVWEDLEKCLVHIADNSYDGGYPSGRESDTGEVTL